MIGLGLLWAQVAAARMRSRRKSLRLTLSPAFWWYRLADWRRVSRAERGRWGEGELAALKDAEGLEEFLGALPEPRRESPR